MRRHFSHQPNVPGRGIVAGYSPRFWGLVALIGVGAGVGAALLTLLLNAVQYAAWDYRSGSYLGAVMSATAARHVVVLLAAGVIAGVGGLLIRRVRGSGAGEISEALWLGGGRLSFWRSQARGVLSIVIVGMGASLGREGAPQLTGAAVATVLSEWAKLPAWQRRLLVACGAGAGMAAVYNVPLGGALFAVEVLLGTLSLPVVLPAVAMSAIATVVAWVVVPDRPTYLVGVFGLRASQVVWAVIIGPLAGLVAVGWVRTVAAVNKLKPRRRGRLLAPIIIFTALGAVSIRYPQLLGNGKDTVALALTSQLAVGLVAVRWCSSRSRPPPASVAAPLVGCSPPRSPSGFCSGICLAMVGPRSGLVRLWAATRSSAERRCSQRRTNAGRCPRVTCDCFELARRCSPAHQRAQPDPHRRLGRYRGPQVLARAGSSSVRSCARPGYLRSQLCCEP